MSNSKAAKKRRVADMADFIDIKDARPVFKGIDNVPVEFLNELNYSISSDRYHFSESLKIQLKSEDDLPF